MPKKKIIIFFLLFPLLINLKAQFKLIEEKIQGKNYRLYFETEPIKHQVINSQNSKQLYFEEYIDESKPGSFIIPKGELFIAIPPQTNPNIRYEIVEKEFIDAVPTINPNIVLDKDGMIISNSVKSWNRLVEQDYINHGIVKINNNECIHLTVSLFNYDPHTNSTFRNKKFVIELTFISDVQLISITNRKEFQVSDVVINKKFASQYHIAFNKSIKSGGDDWIDYQREYLKIGLANDGIYRIRTNDLIGLGVNVNQIDPHTFQLYWKGKEVPIYVSGENDNHFDVNDFIEFIGIKNYGGKYREINAYNTPYNEYLDRYSDTTVVWLTWGKQNGLRVPSHQIQSGTSSITINYYNQLQHYEQNVWFDFSIDQLVRRQLPDWTENETWLWMTQDIGSIDLPFTVSNLVPNKSAKAFLKLQSYAADVITNAHKIGISINNDNMIYDSSSFDSYKQRVINGVFSSNLLTNGNNKIKSVSFPTQATINSVFHDWYEIEYPRSLILNNDSLQFRFDDYKTSELVNYEISGYQGSPVSVYKYEDMLNVTKIANYQTQGGKIIFSDLLDSTKNYFIVAETKTLSPKFYYKKQFKNLRSSSNSAEYLIITNSLLMNSANEYSDFINQAYNKKVALINVLDIYDEFNYGFFSPEPIKDFLMTAYNNWASSKLEYVLLLGSANYDYYENRQKQLPAPAHPDLVPSFGVPVSDNWFINWDNTSIYNPVLKIGRIPARTEDDVRNYLSKHKNYLTQSFSELNKKYLFFSGGLGNDQNELDQFRISNQFVIDNFVYPAPIGGIVHHFYKTLNPNTNFGPYTVTQIQNAIDSSGLFISYLGHSGTQTWDNSITETKQLHNIVNANPLMTDFGCSTGKFAEPDVTSFSELFVTSKDGQAICYIGNTSLGFFSSALVAPKIFYETILKDSVFTISDALNKTKTKLLTQYGSSDVNKIFSLTNSLIGDPIISLSIPPKPNLSISANDITFIPSKVTSQDDSVKCIMRFLNLGRATGQSFIVDIKDRYNNSFIFERKINRTIPLSADSLIINIPVKNKTGEHQISIELDSENSIDEINKSDNKTNVSFLVSNASIRSLTDYDFTNSLNKIKIVNPTERTLVNSFDYQISTNPFFLNPISSSVQFGEYYTKLNLSSLQIGSRYWFRTKLSDQTNYELTKSFVYSATTGYLLNDSLSFSAGSKVNTVVNSGVNLGMEDVIIEAISAGFNDGKTGVITKNNQNYIPSPDRGHNICVFDGKTFELKTYNVFDLLGGGTSVQNSYGMLLDSLLTTDILVVVIIDEGSINLNSSLKQKLRSFGSKYVDSLGFRDSWALIGRKGLSIGSAVESYAKIFKGRAIAKTSFDKRSSEGTYSTQFIGPAKEWKNFDISYQKPNGTKLSYLLMGKTTDNRIDSLQSNTMTNNIIDLTGQLFKSYPYLQLKLKLESSTNGDSPEIKSLFTGYAGAPELGTNYQVVSIVKDTVEQGENIDLSFSVYNVGESRADNFKVNVELVKKDNSREIIFEHLIDSIGVEQKKLFNLLYNTANISGPVQLNINIDPENKILELYKDNNFYSIPIYVKPNTKPASLKLTFDGNDILNGDYISPNPNIKIELNDQSLIPIRDTSVVQIFLNNRPIYFANNTAITYAYSTSNPKFTIEYKPTLQSGEYILKVLGKNATGQLIDSTGIVRNFVVQKELQLLNVYNYPNPFADETYFTFKLTQIPDEMKIKIFTLTGRMIKEFNLTPAELKYDFNRIHWDGRDTDGDLVANGVYLYKILTKKGNESSESIQKLAIVR